MITTGVWAPTAIAKMPTVAVSTYAGATEEIPSSVPPNSPTESLFRPFSAIPNPFRRGCPRVLT